MGNCRSHPSLVDGTRKDDTHALDEGHLFHVKNPDIDSHGAAPERAPLSPAAALAAEDRSSDAFHRRRNKLKQRSSWKRSRRVFNDKSSSIEFHLNPSEEFGSTDTALLDLEDTLHMAQMLLETTADEKALSHEEIKAALQVYKELQRVLSVATRTGNLMARPCIKESQQQNSHDFHDRYTALVQEVHDAQMVVDKALANPAALRPLSVEALQEVNDFFVLDNSLRETTVGAARGHTMEEKLQIVNSMADTGLEEVILGAFGAKVSVDSQVAAHWKTNLGKSFDSTWGFTDAWDMAEHDQDEEEKLWSSVPDFFKAEERGEDYEFFTPSFVPKGNYSKEEVALFKEASKGF
ncbi:expressed unknown protein [Seminavis robusta]|uniref:Uncharacterized protein n=1 Tax=Seminavis robusta TaxID=568900 RepID=A0A9N8E3T8_9STRA|nr:expressed unknown protein [Seminavis robusta]|eukprot:Sro589_g171730.1 n/a (351) ;mRNA; f:24290-25342